MPQRVAGRSENATVNPINQYLSRVIYDLETQSSHSLVKMKFRVGIERGF